MRLKNATFYRRVVVGADPYNQYQTDRQIGIWHKKRPPFGGGENKKK